MSSNHTVVQYCTVTGFSLQYKSQVQSRYSCAYNYNYKTVNVANAGLYFQEYFIH